MIFDISVPKSGASTRQGTGVKFYLTSYGQRCLGKYLRCCPHNFFAAGSRDTRMVDCGPHVARGGPASGPPLAEKWIQNKTIIASISQVFKHFHKDFHSCTDCEHSPQPGNIQPTVQRSFCERVSSSAVSSCQTMTPTQVICLSQP